MDIPGIMNRTVMRIMAGRPVGELHHLQRAEADRAGILQPLQRGGGGGRDPVAANFGAAGDDLAGVVIHVLVRQRHAMQRAATVSFRQRRIGGIRRSQRFLLLDRHERIEARLPLRDAGKAGLRHLARRHALACDGLGYFRQRKSCGFGRVHRRASFWTTRNVAGSRSNGSVPAIGARPSNAGPMELAILAATSSVTGTPATSAIALICFAVGLVIWIVLPLPAQGCVPNRELPYSTPPDGP